MKVHKLFICLFIASSFLVITACGGGGGGGSNPSGEVTMSITDAKPLLPEGAEEATNLWVTFTEVLVHKSGGGWISLPLTGDLPSDTIDLLQFIDGNTTELVPPVLLEYGKYTQIRLVIAEDGAWIRFDNKDDKKYPVVIPPQHLKTGKNFIFDVDQPTAADIVIDFDLSRSLVVIDDGSGTLSYKLKPVLHIVDASEAATISGEIVQGSDAIVTVSVYNPDLDDYEEYTMVEVVWESGTEATGFVIFWLVPNEGLIPPKDYKVEIDVDKDGTLDYVEDNIFLEEGEDYLLGTINLFSDFTIECDSITIKSECEEEPSCLWVFSGDDPFDPFAGHCENAS